MAGLSHLPADWASVGGVGRRAVSLQSRDLTCRGRGNEVRPWLVVFMGLRDKALPGERQQSGHQDCKPAGPILPTTEGIGRPTDASHLPAEPSLTHTTIGQGGHQFRLLSHCRELLIEQYVILAHGATGSRFRSSSSRRI